MPDPAQAAQVVAQAGDAAQVAGGTVGGIAALGVLGRLLQIIVEWHHKRTAAREATEAAKAERRAKSKSEDVTASHRAADKLLQLSDRQTREVERAERRAEEAEEELHDCKRAQRELSDRMDAFEREHAGCPGAAAFAELRGKFEVMATQNEWMENVIHEFTGLTPPSKSMPAPADVAAALQETHGKR